MWRAALPVGIHVHDAKGRKSVSGAESEDRDAEGAGSGASVEGKDKVRGKKLGKEKKDKDALRQEKELLKAQERETKETLKKVVKKDEKEKRKEKVKKADKGKNEKVKDKGKGKRKEKGRSDGEAGKVRINAGSAGRDGPPGDNEESDEEGGDKHDVAGAAERGSLVAASLPSPYVVLRVVVFVVVGLLGAICISGAVA